MIMITSKLTFASLVCLLLTCTAAIAGQTRARRVGASQRPLPAQKGVEIPNGEVLRVDTTLVILPVSVKDRAGRTIQDLTKEHFRIFEEGVEQGLVPLHGPSLRNRPAEAANPRARQRR